MRPEPSAAEAVRVLKDRLGEIIVWGSLHLAEVLLEARFVDRIRLRTAPVLIGEGLRWTPATLGQRVLRLESASSLPSGHVLTEYAVDHR